MMERWDAYTAEGCRTGEYLIRGEPIPAGRYHLVAEVLIRHRDGSWLLMRRDPDKEFCPGLWEASAGGSALAGENALTAAHREVREETGLTIRDLRRIYHETGDSYLFDYFIGFTDDAQDAVRLQPGETVDYRWVDTKTLRALLETDRCMNARMLRTTKLSNCEEDIK